MTSTHPCVLAMNAGSSSVKFALFSSSDPLLPSLHGSIERIGLEGSSFVFFEPNQDQAQRLTIAAPDHAAAISFLLEWLEERNILGSVVAVGHRVVHGIERSEPALVNAQVINEMRHNVCFAPNHLPQELALIEAFQNRCPHLPQLACFDTSFHCSMPRVAQLLPIPRSYEAKGLKRYGFHGLSFSYLIEELATLGDPAAEQGRVILAHLGNGASLAAVRDGHSLDTSMGFTPASGLVMGKRSGDLDPGVIAFVAKSGTLSPHRLSTMINEECGLLGISETSSDMRDLLALETTDIRAAEAVALFCYQAKKWIGAFTAVLEGLDNIVFSGGIGENSPKVRSRICEGLDYLGVELDEARNARSAEVISSKSSRVTVRVIPTNEELMIARAVRQFLETVPRINR